MRKNIVFIFVFMLCWGIITSPPCFGCGFLKPDDFKDHPSFTKYWEAEQLWAAKKWDEAMRKFEEILLEAPDTPFAVEAWFKLGKYEASWGNYEKAVSYFERVIPWMDEIREEEEDGYEMIEIHEAKLSIASIYMEVGRYDEALDFLQDIYYNTTFWKLVKASNALAKEILRRKAHVEAGTASSCGAEALRYVLKEKGVDISDEELFRMAGKSPVMSLKDLQEAAISKGLKATGVKVDFDALSSIPLPAIALLNPNHYVVIDALKRDKVALMNPSLGEKNFLFDREIIKKRWSDYVLVFGEFYPHIKAALLKEEEIEAISGGDDVPPTNRNLGGPEDNSNVEYQEIERSVKGCGEAGDDVGMPKILINTMNFNLVLEDRDLSYSGLGPKVEIIRYYNTDSTYDGIFGRGWSFNYGIYLREEPSGDIIVVRGSGKEDVFIHQGGGVYAPPKAIYDQLTQKMLMKLFLYG
ncbi:MAG: cysteine peptidase family C39 domain-containing protein [Pseudomonadota bacterium]